ncbi:adenosylcobinamide-phosphate synthase CbiB [Puniceibacterium sediminis]|uniref:Cobalamin biosynthesis protein CobD n=1 Tax=Puniceibacterium sediminis TaxID=1608407 RepID=A0A238WBV2_9RHOB|nr:adenosylcobinamide-phosphate synthase CbiB [Puniceibacterium sediminis]SNR43713.1 adenosylcobinamide-phosphate synthase [Puniceibacterium sediminis]
MSFAASLLLALLIEATLAWPTALYRRIGHPVTWIGRLITLLETALNRPEDGKFVQNLRGAVTVALVLIAVTTPVWLIATLLPDGWPGVLLGGILAWPLLAARSLYDHVAAVAKPLAQGDTTAARHAVSMIVGRDPAQLDDAAIARAALESLAENASDGVVAPVFWGLVLGLPGLAAYKAINTMDSMIGHRSPRYEHFGMVAARLDDLVNLLPARLTGLLFALMSGRLRACLATTWRDAPHHRSPNAGWAESAMAAALSVRLSGPRIYGTRIADEPWLNADAPDPGAADLQGGLALYRRAMLLLGCGVALLALI